MNIIRQKIPEITVGASSSSQAASAAQYEWVEEKLAVPDN